MSPVPHRAPCTPRCWWCRPWWCQPGQTPRTALQTLLRIKLDLDLKLDNSGTLGLEAGPFVWQYKSEKPCTSWNWYLNWTWTLSLTKRKFTIVLSFNCDFLCNDGHHVRTGYWDTILWRMLPTQTGMEILPDTATKSWVYVNPNAFITPDVWGSGNLLF